MQESYLEDLRNCKLCEWRCGVNRLKGERGVCGIGKPKVASSTLHPAPPESYTIFLAGCNFRCLNCQNWSIAHFPVSDRLIRPADNPKELAERAYSAINSPEGKRIAADRIFFSGGSPTPSLPYVEKVVEEARKIGDVKVNYDTNGFMTESSLNRVLDFATSITFDIKAYHDEVHRALTGAPVDPVLRNAKFVAENARDKLWEFRTLIIPFINEGEVEPLARLLSEIDPSVPLNLLAFRPNFVLEDHLGATREIMKNAVQVAEEAGLENVTWSGRVGLSGEVREVKATEYELEGPRLAGGIAKEVGCVTHPRMCGDCDLRDDCPIKGYRPSRTT